MAVTGREWLQSMMQNVVSQWPKMATHNLVLSLERMVTRTHHGSPLAAPTWQGWCDVGDELNGNGETRKSFVKLGQSSAILGKTRQSLEPCSAILNKQ